MVGLDASPATTLMLIAILSKPSVKNLTNSPRRPPRSRASGPRRPCCTERLILCASLASTGQPGRSQALSVTTETPNVGELGLLTSRPSILVTMEWGVLVADL